MKSFRALVRAAAVAIASIAAVTHANAEEPFPNRYIRFVVPFPPGGASDIFARLIGQKMAESMGQPVVIENRPGAGGMVGSTAVAHSRPDGYTMLYGSTGPNAINASLYEAMPYDPVKDFTGVTEVNVLPLVLMVNPDLPVKTLQDLIQLARSKPGSINFGSVGRGSAHHLAAEMLKSMANIDIKHIPYQGSSPALVDLIAGRIQMHFDTYLAAKSQIDAGAVRAIAVSSAQRFSKLPNVPTVAEAGLPGFEINVWQNVVVPAGTPAPIVNRLNLEIHKALAAPEVMAQLDAIGAVVVVNSPEQETERIKSEVERWAALVKKFDIEKIPQN